MARRCRVCDSEDLDAINARLVARPNFLALQREYGISEDSFRRHARDHIPRLLVKSIGAQVAGNAERLVAIVDRTLADLDWAADRGREKGDTRAVIMAAGKRVSVVEALVRVHQALAVDPIDPPTPLPRRTVTEVVALLRAEQDRARAEVTVRVERPDRPDEGPDEQPGAPRESPSGVRHPQSRPPSPGSPADLWPDARAV